MKICIFIKLICFNYAAKNKLYYCNRCNRPLLIQFNRTSGFIIIIVHTERNYWFPTAHERYMSTYSSYNQRGNKQDITISDIYMDHSRPLMVCVMIFRCNRKEQLPNKKKLPTCLHVRPWVPPTSWDILQKKSFIMSDRKVMLTICSTNQLNVWEVHFKASLFYIYAQYVYNYVIQQHVIIVDCIWHRELGLPRTFEKFLFLFVYWQK